MRIVWAWLRLEVRARWRALTVLALLVALATATILGAVAGAQRGRTAYGRLAAGTLPATATVLANQPGFNWARIRALPEVTALSEFGFGFGFGIAGVPPGSAGVFTPVDAALTATIERPIVLQGRRYDPRRADEVVVTRQFATAFGKRPGDSLVLLLASPQQVDAGYDGSSGAPPRGPKVTVHIVGVIRSPWFLDSPGGAGGVISSPALFAQHRTSMLGTQHIVPVNALLRLAGGPAAIPRFRADLARVTGRSDIDVWNNSVYFGDSVRRVTGYEAACLLAFAIAALAAALFLIGQSVARYLAATVTDLQVLQAVGLTRRQGVAAAVAAPLLAAVLGASLGVAAAIVASRWMPIGAAALAEPHPGLNADWLVLGAGWVLAPLLILAGATAVAARALSARRRDAAARRSLVAATATRAGLPVPLVIGTRFALEPGRGLRAVPVRPAVLGAVAGVLGVLAAFTFAAGVSDAAANPVRFGQTFQLGAFFGFNGMDGGPAAERALAAAAADRDVTGFDDARIAGAQSGQFSVESYTYAPVHGKRLPVVLLGGRMPAAPDEIVLAPVSARELRAQPGSVIRLAGGGSPLAERVTGIGFVPVGPHNSYADGAWLTPAGYDRLFAGAHYRFKYHAAAVSLRPGANVRAVARRLHAAAARAGDPGLTFTPPDPLPDVQAIQDLQALPVALSAFLALLAIAAVAYALSATVRRRRHELAVLRALGLTRRQVRLAVAVQATVLALAGLAFGIPLGLIVGRAIWRVVAGFTPLAYHPPLAPWALLLIGPAALLVVNVVASWPERRAARLRAGQVLRTE
jgi:hypothetical protein